MSPQAVEGQLLSIPVVAQAVVVGDRREYLAALADAHLEPGSRQKPRLPEVRRAQRDGCRDLPDFHAHLRRQIDAVNQKLARVQTVKTFAILPHELTIAGGELTPTMKLKRRVILAKYEEEIEGLYR